MTCCDKTRTNCNQGRDCPVSRFQESHPLHRLFAEPSSGSRYIDAVTWLQMRYVDFLTFWHVNAGHINWWFLGLLATMAVNAAVLVWIVFKLAGV